MDEGSSVESQANLKSAEKPKNEKLEDKGARRLVSEIRRSTAEKTGKMWDIARRINDLKYDPRTYEVANKVMEVGFFAGAVVSMFNNPDIPASFTMNAPGLINASFGKFDISPNVPLPAKTGLDFADAVGIPGVSIVTRAFELAPDLRVKGQKILSSVKRRITDERIDYNYDPKVGQAMQTFGVESPQLAKA